MSKGRTQTWTSIWRRMSPTERREAAFEYVREAENSPKAREGAIKFLSQECRTSPNAIAGWDLDRRADRLARAAQLKPVHFASLVAAFHVRRRTPMLTRFLDEAGIPHINGVVDPRTMGDARAKDALVRAVLALRGGFPTREVELYLRRAGDAGEPPCSRTSPRPVRTPPRCRIRHPPPSRLPWPLPRTRRRRARLPDRRAEEGGAHRSPLLRPRRP